MHVIMIKAGHVIIWVYCVMVTNRRQFVQLDFAFPSAFLAAQQLYTISSQQNGRITTENATFFVPKLL